MTNRPASYFVGGVRLGVGTALVVAPGVAGRIWIGPHADGPGTRLFARVIGARDVFLGASVLQATRQDGPTRQLIQAGVVADVADVVATVMTARHLTPARRVAMPLIAGAVAAAGVAAYQAIRRDEQEEPVDIDLRLETSGHADRPSPGYEPMGASEMPGGEAAAEVLAQPDVTLP